ncbi:hypothetical protein NLJ89_g5811 [Agrocybe chaxingu]|uniref:Spindle pole body component n=1 Tax=Agrocybe chaxingu TaxID=84603 RepID=A0A9W8MWL5_9AGAR|nr:hypothetical protein NLJ89_g5811 [Agrocybe chaxingu]
MDSAIWPPFEPIIDAQDVFAHYHQKLQDLPRLVPRLFVPVLENKPQNPIMESLKLEAANTSLPKRPFVPPKLPEELAALAFDALKPPRRNPEDAQRSIQQFWMEAATRKLGVRSGILSWDRLRRTHTDKAVPTVFLSEQEELVYSSARYHGMESILSVNHRELLLSLKSTVLGISSQFHVWDSISERFAQVGTLGNGKRGVLLLDGKDDVISASLISRFVTIGTLTRRLELLLSSLRTRSAREGPTIHALAHSLSTTLNFIREILSSCPPTVDEVASTTDALPLSAIWTHYAANEELLVALAELYGRDYGLRPDEYNVLESSPVPLLSRIYDHLARHFERQSPPIIRATIAYILKNASQGYIQQVAHSIGFGGQPTYKPVKKERKDQYEFEEEEEEEEDLLDLLDTIETSFPSFFPLKLLQALPAAQKSLVLFRIAQPDHPLLRSPTAKASVRWLWTEEEILAAWNGCILPEEPIAHSSAAPPPSPSAVPELSIFKLFNLEPGTKAIDVQDSSSSTLRKFVDMFPSSLPPITPTLAELASLTFKDLMQHASTLSSTLLSLFIGSPGKLNFRSHLILLRSYLLLAAPSFKSRLLNALFSDAGEYEVDITPHSMSLRLLRRHPGKRPKEKEGKQPWAVGLSPNLLERETWPPVGADLSFFLRTVIVDSLDQGKETEDGTFEREDVVEEAEWRLGFAIRDLPTGAGKDKWLDPLSIEALDFLYMDYKPPHPLEILISPEILAKYQRMFTFLLRLQRVECALKSLFRMSTHRAIAKFLFPTLAQSRKLLLHFRFVAQAFVSSLSGYVFDTAIGGNFDPFLARLSVNVSSTSSSEPNDRDDGFSDVFELAQCHSALLDDILSACLLRSGQRGVGDILRHALELVLEFTIVVGELHRGRIEEYQAAPLVEELFNKFCTKMTTLTKVLKGLVDKSPSSSKLSLEAYFGGRRRSTGGLDALYHLLVRIDLTDWWSKSTKTA